MRSCGWMVFRHVLRTYRSYFVISFERSSNLGERLEALPGGPSPARSGLWSFSGTIFVICLNLPEAFSPAVPGLDKPPLPCRPPERWRPCCYLTGPWHHDEAVGSLPFCRFQAGFQGCPGEAPTCPDAAIDFQKPSPRSKVTHSPGWTSWVDILVLDHFWSSPSFGAFLWGTLRAAPWPHLGLGMKQFLCSADSSSELLAWFSLTCECCHQQSRKQKFSKR